LGRSYGLGWESFRVETSQPVEGRLTFIFGVEDLQPIEQVEGRHLVMGGEKFEKE